MARELSDSNDAPTSLFWQSLNKAKVLLAGDSPSALELERAASCIETARKFAYTRREKMVIVEVMADLLRKMDRGNRPSGR